MTEHYDELISKLDTPAKVRLLTGASFATLRGHEGIGLAPLTVSDGPRTPPARAPSSRSPSSSPPREPATASGSTASARA